MGSESHNWEDVLPGNLRLSQLPLELSLRPSEAITAVLSYESNLYIGTSEGRMHHFHWFDDANEYTAISQISVNDKKAPVAKLLLLPDVSLCLILCNRTIYPHSLPELSPCHMGKIKDANDMLALSQVKNPKTKNPLDKIIVYSLSRIRVVRFLGDTIKLLKDINYQNAIVGRSSAAGTLANYSNICLVANDTNYDVVDMQQTRRISLFEYNIDKAPDVLPYIVPFAAEDTGGNEEYLLTIRSDASTSLAMFTNSFGDATRGTLTWLEAGYPTNGVCVVWPNVLGIFASPDGKHTLVISSLTTLDVVKTMEITGLFDSLGFSDPGELRLSHDNLGVDFLHTSLLHLMLQTCLDGLSVLHTHSSKSHVIIHGASSLYLLYEEDPLYLALQPVEQVLEGAGDNDLLVSLCLHLDQNADLSPVLPKLHALFLLVTGDLEKAKLCVTSNNLDVLMFLYLLDKDSENNHKHEVWDHFSVESIVVLCLNKYRPLEGCNEFRSWLLDTCYQFSPSKSSPLQLYLRHQLYSDKHSSSDIVDVVEKDDAVWRLGRTKDNDDVCGLLAGKTWYFALIHVLLKLQTVETTEQTALEITKLCLGLLKGSLKDESCTIGEDGAASADNKAVDLVETAFLQLSSCVDDKDVYTKNILELFKLFPARGLELLEGNKDSKHRKAHLHILNELTKTSGQNAGLSLLKMELLELSLKETSAEQNRIDIELVDELLAEILDYLAQNRINLTGDFENLSLLFDAFKVHNSLRDTPAHHISWADFLGVHGRNSEGKKLVELYLKIYELLVIKQHENSPLSTGITTFDSPPFDAINEMFTQNDGNKLVSYLVGIGDYYSADHVVMYGTMPFPKKTVYWEGAECPSLKKEATIGRSAMHLATLYLANEDQLSRLEGVSQVFKKYGKKYFSFTEVMEFLPDDFPFYYVLDYFMSVVSDAEVDKADSNLKKALVKSDARIVRMVHDDFNKTHKDILDPR